MTGYQEVLTDPSYAGQIVVLTYPLVGNYGINADDFESRRIQVAGLVVREHCPSPSHGLSTATLHEFLASQGIPGISGVDTRSVTRRLRSRGVMMGSIYPAGDGNPGPSGEAAADPAEEALARLRDVPRYDDVDFVKAVTTAEPYCWDSSKEAGHAPQKDSRGRLGPEIQHPAPSHRQGLRGDGPFQPRPPPTICWP